MNAMMRLFYLKQKYEWMMLMQNLVYLGIEIETFRKFQKIHQQLNEGHTESISQELGEVLATISCGVVEQVFGEIERLRSTTEIETENTLQQINESLQKYMPWSVSLFNNDRLKPIVNYLDQHIYKHEHQSFLTYKVDPNLLAEAENCLLQIKQGNRAYIQPAFKAFTQIVDQGIHQLIIEPKKMLKFNFVVDKTLTGVIHLTTQLGYKRIEKLAAQFDLAHSEKTLAHFFSFLDEPKHE